MNIVYFYVENSKIHAPTCYQRILELKDKYNIQMELIDSNDEFGYWKAVNRYWGKDDLIFIEHDMLVEPEMLDSFLACNEKACIYYYNTSIEKNYLNQGYRIADQTWNMLLAEKEFNQIGHVMKYVTFTGMGFTKISKVWQQKPLEKFGVRNKPEFSQKGLNVDNAVISNINSYIDAFCRFHCHGKIQHMHPNLLNGETYAKRYDAFMERDKKN